MAAYKNIDVIELSTMLSKGSIRLVDVRSEEEVRHGFIQGASKVPLHLLPVKLSELDKASPTVFYCRIGARSAQAASFAAAQGFADAYNLQGGIMAWAQAGLPLVV